MEYDGGAEVVGSSRIAAEKSRCYNACPKCSDCRSIQVCTIINQHDIIHLTQCQSILSHLARSAPSLVELSRRAELYHISRHHRSVHPFFHRSSALPSVATLLTFLLPLERQANAQTFEQATTASDPLPCPTQYTHRLSHFSLSTVLSSSLHSFIAQRLILVPSSPSVCC